MAWQNLELKGRAGRPVSVNGDTWTIWGAGQALELDWQRVRGLPAWLLEPAVAYLKHMVETQSLSSVDGIFKCLKLLVACPSIKKLNRASEALFTELRQAARNDYAVVHRYRKFYFWAVSSGYDGFDYDVAEEIYSVRVGQPKTPGAFNGRCPPFDRETFDWLGKAVREAPPDILSIAEKNVLAIHYIFGPNPGPVGLLRAEDVGFEEEPDGTKKWFIDIPRHKKRNVHERAASRRRRTTEGVAKSLTSLAAENAARIDRLGLSGQVAVPIFMRSLPRCGYLSDDCPVQEYAMHMNSAEVADLLQQSLDKLCAWAGRAEINASPRRFRRTRLLLHRLGGLPDDVVADIADHSSTRILTRYATLGFHVVKQLDALMGQYFAELRREFEAEPDPRPRLEAMGIEMLRKTRVFA